MLAKTLPAVNNENVTFAKNNGVGHIPGKDSEHIEDIDFGIGAQLFRQGKSASACANDMQRQGWEYQGCCNYLAEVERHNLDLREADRIVQDSLDVDYVYGWE